MNESCIAKQDYRQHKSIHILYHCTDPNNHKLSIGRHIDNTQNDMKIN